MTLPTFHGLPAHDAAEQAPTILRNDCPRCVEYALRTTNPIERVNRECKRRSRAMDTVGPKGLQELLAFTALRLEAK